jgi:hypothetical protein
LYCDENKHEAINQKNTSGQNSVDVLKKKYQQKLKKENKP